MLKVSDKSLIRNMPLCSLAKTPVPSQTLARIPPTPPPQMPNIKITNEDVKKLLKNLTKVSVPYNIHLKVLKKAPLMIRGGTNSQCNISADSPARHSQEQYKMANVSFVFKEVISRLLSMTSPITHLH